MKNVNRWKKKGISLKTGESFSKAGQKMEYGAIIVDLKVKGQVEVLINGQYSYNFSDESISEGCIGTRFSNTAPSVEVKAGKDSVIEDITILIQRPH